MNGEWRMIRSNVDVVNSTQQVTTNNLLQRLTVADGLLIIIIGLAAVLRWGWLGMLPLSAEEAAMAKWWCSEVAGRAIDKCLQLHGGYGYMLEYPIAKFYLDVRIDPIHGGTNEIMKMIVGRSIGF